ncbi:peptidase S8/S53 domain-containing protein [Suillus subaureus]|uniref:Peptidase S8/S53 domain-containing protein n=1 Tax=Suillus subaureus TaxID=48587 RepID=A0A9P7EEJ9_9AGAM|nr:peptidase S8/S53 domain-containing protein [Suillus subaureus]KAG1818970.1 peptidase S8/S53 domain-containing protein [Suillus subaureus]
MISTSYGDDEQTVLCAYAIHVCTGMAALGACRVSLLFSSGDCGIGDTNSNPAMQVLSDLFNQGAQQPILTKSVTSVGGVVSIPEIAVPFSSGGFSNYFAHPVYQEAAVSAYLVMLAPHTYEVDLLSPAPDVHLLMWQHNQTISLLFFKAPLGFLNPFLYSIGYMALNDITDGNNPGCGTLGFNATVGWDPVTGYSTPNFKKLKDLVLAMP